MEYVDYVYDIVRLDCEGMDAIYGDYIKQMVGVYGLNALITEKLVENCGVINGRQLYVLCDKPVKNKEYDDDYEKLRKENQKLKDFLLRGF